MMPQIMNARPVLGLRCPETDFTRDNEEQPIDSTDFQFGAVAGHKKEGQAGRRWQLAEEPVAVFHKSRDGFECGLMQRDQSRLAELRLADGEHTFGPINVSGLQIDHFTNTHSRHRQNAKDAIVGFGPEPIPQRIAVAIPRWIRFRACEQTQDFGFRVKVGARAR